MGLNTSHHLGQLDAYNDCVFYGAQADLQSFPGNLGRGRALDSCRFQGFRAAASTRVVPLDFGCPFSPCHIVHCKPGPCLPNNSRGVCFFEGNLIVCLSLI
jgi:hypothetical protein